MTSCAPLMPPPACPGALSLAPGFNKLLGRGRRRNREQRGRGRKMGKKEKGREEPAGGEERDNEGEEKEKSVRIRMRKE